MSLLVALQPRLGVALVVGGGNVATRKVRGLVEAGFSARVVSPAVSDAIRETGAEVAQRPFAEGDVEGIALVFACTDERAVNRRVGEICRKAGIPVNVCDARQESTFFSVATLRAGDATIGVSTGGDDPAGAARIRDRVAAALDADIKAGAPR
jgi:siroheme synthase-like protein